MIKNIFTKCDNCSAEFHRTLEICPYCTAPFRKYRRINRETSEKIFFELERMSRQIQEQFERPWPQFKRAALTSLKLGLPSIILLLIVGLGFKETYITVLSALIALPFSGMMIHGYIYGSQAIYDEQREKWLNEYAFPHIRKILAEYDLDFDDLDEIIRRSVSHLPKGEGSYAAYFSYNPDRWNPK